jgi:hypothetical protein
MKEKSDPLETRYQHRIEGLEKEVEDWKWQSSRLLAALILIGDFPNQRQNKDLTFSEAVDAMAELALSAARNARV